MNGRIKDSTLTTTVLPSNNVHNYVTLVWFTLRKNVFLDTLMAQSEGVCTQKKQ